VNQWDEERKKGLFPGFRTREGSLTEQAANLQEAVKIVAAEKFGQTQ
jgi:hypothetical protein